MWKLIAPEIGTVPVFSVPMRNWNANIENFDDFEYLGFLVYLWGIEMNIIINV